MLPQYTNVVGQKFHADGTVRVFPGNTIICFVYPDLHSKIFHECVWAQRQLQEMSCHKHFGFLPPDSFHMTVMSLLCDQVREPEKWAKPLSLETSFEKTDEFFISKLKGVAVPVEFQMQYKSMRGMDRDVVAINLQPENQMEGQKLGDYRNQVSDLTGVRHPDHDDFSFHISLAYKLIKPDGENREEFANTLARIDMRLRESFGTFVTTSPQLVFFDDMFTYLPENERHLLSAR